MASCEDTMTAVPPDVHKGARDRSSLLAALIRSISPSSDCCEVPTVFQEIIIIIIIRA